MNQAENHSEVARLLKQIDLEIEAAQQGLSGLASGAARHSFINARLERMGELHDSLHTLVGEQAIVLIAQQLEALPDGAEAAETTSQKEAQTNHEPQ
jgi:hypothetical protein